MSFPTDQSPWARPADVTELVTRQRRLALVDDERPKTVRDAGLERMIAAVTAAPGTWTAVRIANVLRHRGVEVRVKDVDAALSRRIVWENDISTHPEARPRPRLRGPARLLRWLRWTFVVALVLAASATTLVALG